MSLKQQELRLRKLAMYREMIKNMPKERHADAWVLVNNRLMDEENARALLAALVDFGFAEVGLDVSDFLKPTTVVLGRAPDQIDIMTSIKGVDLAEAWQRRITGALDGIEVAFIARQDLIANKRAVGRPEDLADIARLGEQ